jgi:hypothetical protein
MIVQHIPALETIAHTGSTLVFRRLVYGLMIDINTYGLPRAASQALAISRH